MVTGIFGAPGSRLALGFEQAGRERRHPDRRLEPRPEIEQRAVVVLMRMGDDDAAQVGELLLDEADVGQDQVDARQLRRRERSRRNRPRSTRARSAGP